ncbi:MAG: PPC domain-containing protein, partial [bacterium]
FQVSKMAEISEKDRNDPEALPPLAQTVPVVLNGQIMPGEVDSFPLLLKAGQKLQITASARDLIPYLADAVPGWFQSVLVLCNEQGDELAYACENGFDPDPSLFYTVTKDGTYFLRIRDSLYRGREDFVYRVAIELQTPRDTLFPFQSLTRVLNGMIPTAMYPLTPYVDAQISQVDDTEPNDTSATAQKITFPAIVKGKIAKAGDVDVYQFSGNAGETMVAEIYARRLGSPMDSLLRILDSTGKIIAMNDDNKNPEMGMITNYTDSYLLLKLPATGSYFVQVSDSLRQGGDDFNYYLRVSSPQGDFALRMTPSTLNISPGTPIVFTVYAFRKDGWDGDIDIVLKDAPAGFTINGARIPKGQNQVRMTLIAPPSKTIQQLTLQLEGHATIGGKAISRPVIASENKMQAFAYYHLVPEGQLLVLLKRGGIRSIISLKQAAGEKLLIPSGGELKVSIPIDKTQAAPNILKLVDPPAWITTKDVSFTPTSINFTLVADDKHLGYADNLIIEALTEQEIAATATAKARKQRNSMGLIPAIAFEIVK